MGLFFWTGFLCDKKYLNCGALSMVWVLEIKKTTSYSNSLRKVSISFNSSGSTS